MRRRADVARRPRRSRDLSTPILPPDMARFYRQHYGNAHLMMVYDAAHLVDLDRPEAVTEVVSDFLARKERFLVSEKSGVIHP